MTNPGSCPSCGTPFSCCRAAQLGAGEGPCCPSCDHPVIATRTFEQRRVLLSEDERERLRAVPHDLEQVAVAEMRARSGAVESDSMLVSFLYVLLRDEVTPGRLEAVLERSIGEPEKARAFTNGWLAEYAKDVAARLTTGGKP